jgi:hypothetical protein
MTFRQRVRIKKGGSLEITHPSLLPGQEAEVTVTVPEPAAETGERDQHRSARPLWQRVVEIGASVPDEDWAKVPTDLSKNLDHYLYGSPKGEKE